MPFPQSSPLPPVSMQKNPASVQANLFEQLGTTPQINKVKSFVIALPVGATDGAIDPLPDINEY